MSRRFIVNFHGIGAPDERIGQAERPYWCPESTFAELAATLSELSADERTQVEITFDDGNLSDATVGLPTLQSNGLRATFFICTGRIGQPGYLAASQLQDLLDAGMTIGTHGHDHVDLRHVDDKDLAIEATASRDRLESLIQRPVTQFALPFGSYDRRVLRALSGYAEVFTSDGGYASPGQWLTPRLSYVRGWGPDQLRRLASEEPSTLRQLRRAAKLRWKSIR